VYVKALIALLTHVRTLHRLAFRDHVELGKGLLVCVSQSSFVVRAFVGCDLAVEPHSAEWSKC
jgi:hypothetical protein